MAPAITNSCARERCRKEFALSATPQNARRQKYCSERCQQLEWARKTAFQWRKNNPEAYQAHMRRQIERIKTLVREAKALPCKDCNLSYPSYVMDFDHVRGKKRFTIGTNAFRMGIGPLLKEIKKCDVVCSNCHRERTHRRKQK